MATSLTSYLRLRVNSNLTADAKYNLERIDALGATFVTDSTNELQIRSETDITIEPNSADIGGSGTGGSVSFGSTDHVLDSIAFNSAAVIFSVSPGFLDTASGGTGHLSLVYKSDLSGSVDLTDRNLRIDLNGADRNLILGGNLSVLGADLSLTLTAPLALTLPVDYGTPDQVLSTDGLGGLSWQTVSGGGGGGDVAGASVVWSNGDGTTKILIHSLNSTAVEVQIYESGTQILVDTITVNSTSQITLTSSEAPATSWLVILQAKP